MSCSSKVEPLQFRFQNNTLTDDGRAVSNGIALQIGTPPQLFSLTPTTLLNNTFVNNIATCGSDTNSSCISVIGGGFDPSASSTFASTTADAWNGTDESGPDAFAAIPALYFNDDLTVASSKVPGFPLLIESTGVNLYAGLGLGKNSTFINRLVEADLAPSKSWSMYPGVYSDTGTGSLIIGGYADRFYTGQLYTKNISNTTIVPSWEVMSMEYQSDSTTVKLLPDGVPGSFTAILDYYYPTLTVPNEMLWKWGNATKGTWSQTDLLHTYPSNNVPTGNITVTLANGLKTTIPNKALFDPPAYDNGILSTLRNGSNATVYSVFEPWDVLTGGGGASPTNSGLFGMPYAALVYVIQDWEKHQLSIANANPSAAIGGDSITICSGRNSKKAKSSHTGAVAGGVVGGVVGLALLAALVWFLWRRKRRDKSKAAKSGTTIATDDPTEFSKAELPQYSAVNHKSPTEGKASSTPVQEISGKDATAELAGQQATTELPGSQLQHSKELPGDNKVVRSELPA